MRKLNKIVMAMSLLAPVAAYPLGVGELTLHSALNENLSAEIALDLSSDEVIRDVNIQLASPEKFAEAGIAWHYFLSDIRFEIVSKGHNTFFIKMLSNDIIEEPFLDFLLEIKWPKGQIFKSFTVLIDPPIMAIDEFIAPVAPQQQMAKTKEIIKTQSQAYLADGALVAVVKQGTYGPTQLNDSLWKVAEKVNKDKSIAVEQVMMALYEANQHAFYKQNVNALMAGKMLKVPSLSKIKQTSATQAKTDFYQQNDIWLGKKTKKSVPVVAAGVKKERKQLVLVSPIEDEVGDSEVLAVEPEHQKKLRLENQALQERLARLEQKFSLMEEMLVVKDQELATLQSTYLNEDQKRTDLKGKSGQLKEAKAQTDTVDSAIERDKTKIALIESKEEQGVVKSPVKSAPPVVKLETENNYFILFTAFFAFLLILLGGLFWRKRRTKPEDNEEEPEENIFKSSAPLFSEEILDESDNAEFEPPILEENIIVATNENQGAVSIDEVLLSADTSLAYGKYKEAEENLRAALVTSPDRDEYKLKLLEIFYSSENDIAFGEYAQILKNEGREKDSVFWSKVLDMGMDFMPDNTSLFSDSSENELIEENKLVDQPTQEPAVSDDDSFQLDAEEEPTLVEESVLPVRDESEQDVKEEELEDSFDFDFDLEIEDPVAPKLSEPAAIDLEADPSSNGLDEEVFEFDLPETSIESDALEADILVESELSDAVAIDAEADIEEEVFEFDLPEATLEADALAPDISLESELNELVAIDDEEEEVFELDLPEANLEEDSLELEASVESESVSDLENFEFALSDELDTTTPLDSDDVESDVDENLEAIDFSDDPFAHDDTLDIENIELGVDDTDLSMDELLFIDNEDAMNDGLLADIEEQVEDSSDEQELLPKIEELDAELADFDFDFSTEGDASYVPVDLTKKKNPRAAKQASIEEEFDFDLDAIAKPSREESLGDEIEMDVLNADISDVYDFQTSFDLAEMYAAMGDGEAALDVLKEIMEKGSDTEKQQAEVLIKDID